MCKGRKGRTVKYYYLIKKWIILKMNREKHMTSKFNYLVNIILISFFITGCADNAYAEEKDREYAPTRYGMSVTAGSSYDPTNNIGFYMMSGFILYDYDKVWKHNAPDQLRFKAEGSLGVADDHKTRAVASMNIFALYYLDMFESQTFRPYLEGGVGIIYTDFQIKGQGLRINFNPQLGLGTEIKMNSDSTFFLTLRLHHISNGGIDDENRGINSFMCMLGYYF